MVMSDPSIQSPAMRALAEFRRALTSRPIESIDLVRVEKEMLEHLCAVGCEMMKAVLERADTREPEVEINGAMYGNRRSGRGTYHTTFGPIEVERSSYQRGGRGRVAVPMELRLGMVEGSYTPKLARVLSQATARMPNEEAHTFLDEVGLAKVSISTLHRVPRAMAARFEQQRAPIKTAMREADSIPAGAASVQVGLDGVMVPMDSNEARPRGRKTESPEPPRHEQRYGPMPASAYDDQTPGRVYHEASVGTLAFVDTKGEVLKTIYLGEMPEPLKATLVEDLHDELNAVLRERPDLDVVFASDGAPQQWTALEEIEADLPEGFAKRRMYLADMFHVAEYLQLAADAVHGEATPAAKELSEHWRVTLKIHDDGALRVLKSMRYHRKALGYSRRVQLDKAIEYLAVHRNAGRTNYAEAIRRNYPIGTGVTEAAAKTLVSVRMKRAGARYSHHGGQTILLFRSVVLSGRFPLLSRLLEASYEANVVTRGAA
jgi:hypothetical protein